METKITNYDIRELQDSICDLIGRSNMPIEIVRLMINDIANSINAQANNVILQEKIQKQNEEKEKEKETDKKGE